MVDAFSFKKGMRLPSRTIVLAGNGVTSLAQLDPGSIKFVYRKKGVVERNEILATITDAAAMKVRVDFAALDVDEIAAYQWHVEATIGGLGMAFPERGFYQFSVTDTIAL